MTNNIKIIDIGIILYPSTRALAYLDVFRTLKILPSEIILMDRKISPSLKLQKEDKLFNYSQKFFKLYYDLKNLNSNPNIKKYWLDAKSINSEEIIKVLKKCKNKTFIFTGGGTLGKKILSLDKKFLHIHPGLLPKYKGSTCFYYSILNENKISCSAFYMDNKIDHGDLIDTFSFKFNIKVYNKQPLFIDQIFDPFIRSLALKKILIKIIQGKKLLTKSQKNKSTIQPYFIAHPLIRLFCIKKINDLFKGKRNYINIIE